MKIAKLIGTTCGALVLSATVAIAQPFDDDGFGWESLLQQPPQPLRRSAPRPPLAALPPGAQYYNGAARVGYPVTPGIAGMPERAYRYPSYRPAYVAPPPRAARKQRPVKRRLAQRR